VNFDTLRLAVYLCISYKLTNSLAVSCSSALKIILKSVVYVVKFPLSLLALIIYIFFLLPNYSDKWFIIFFNRLKETFSSVTDFFII
jgi:hypothetical protein